MKIACSKSSGYRRTCVQKIVGWQNKRTQLITSLVSEHFFPFVYYKSNNKLHKIRLSSSISNCILGRIEVFILSVGIIIMAVRAFLSPLQRMYNTINRVAQDWNVFFCVYSIANERLCTKIQSIKTYLVSRINLIPMFCTLALVCLHRSLSTRRPFCAIVLWCIKFLTKHHLTVACSIHFAKQFDSFGTNFLLHFTSLCHRFEIIIISKLLLGRMTVPLYRSHSSFILVISKHLKIECAPSCEPQP